MENRRKRFCARSRIHLWAALVLVSVGAHSFSSRHGSRLPPPGLALDAWNYRLAKRLLGDECGMAAFGNRAPGISSHTLGQQAAFWKCFLRRRNRKFRHRGPNRQFCLANLRWRTALADHGPAGPDGI